jgi:hypothetical protein
MILGMSFSTFTTLHVVISLIGIVTGIVVLVGMLNRRRPGGLTAVFLATTALTSVTGFMFPFSTLLPSHVVGIISLAVLAIALFALYGRGLSGAWRSIYIVTATVALYLNVFVGVVQAFQKIAFLQSLAPTQAEAPFIVAQVAVLVVFAVLGFVAVRNFHPDTGAPA